jgi:hypothetical protein
MNIPLGTIRVCKCGEKFEHFGRNDRLCHECYRAYARDCYRKRRQNPNRAALDNLKARARMERNKQEVLNYMKTCRCHNCRESNPVCLRAIKPDGKVWQVATYYRQRLTIFKLKSILKDCQISCLNCLAASGNTHSIGQILRASA